jgi:hypothetical protein
VNQPRRAVAMAAIQIVVITEHFDPEYEGPDPQGQIDVRFSTRMVAGLAHYNTEGTFGLHSVLRRLEQTDVLSGFIVNFQPISAF